MNKTLVLIFVMFCLCTSSPAVVGSPQTQEEIREMSLEQVHSNYTRLTNLVRRSFQEKDYANAIKHYRLQNDVYKRYLQLSPSAYPMKVILGYQEITGLCYLQGEFELAVELREECLEWATENTDKNSNEIQDSNVELEISRKINALNLKDKTRFQTAYERYYNGLIFVNSTFRHDRNYFAHLHRELGESADVLADLLGTDNWYTLHARYTTFMHWSPETAIPSDQVEHLVEQICGIRHFLPTNPKVWKAKASLAAIQARYGEISSPAPVFRNLLHENKQFKGPVADRIELLQMLADTERGDGNPKTAYRILKEIIDSYPENDLKTLNGVQTHQRALVHGKMGKVLANLGDVDEAIKHLEIAEKCWLRMINFQGVNFHSASQEYFADTTFCSKLLSQAERHEEALLHAKTSLEFAGQVHDDASPEFQRMNLALAEVFARSSQPDKAMEMIEFAIKVLESDKEAGSSMLMNDKYQAVSVALMAGRANWALEMLEQLEQEMEQLDLPKFEEFLFMYTINDCKAYAHLLNNQSTLSFRAASAIRYSDIRGLVGRLMDLDESEATATSASIHDLTTIMAAAMDKDSVEHRSMTLARVIQTKAIGAQLLSDRDKLIESLDDKSNEMLRTEYREIRRRLSAIAYSRQLGETENRNPDLEEVAELKRLFLAKHGTKLKLSYEVPDDWNAVLDDLKRTLPPHAVVVEILKNNRTGPGVKIYDQGAYQAFIARHDNQSGLHVEFVDLGEIKAVDSALKTWLSQFVVVDGRGVDRVETRDSKKIQIAGKFLHDKVWKKIETNLGGNFTVVMCADGALTQLPWSTLPNGRTMTLQNGKKVEGRLLDDFQFVDLLASRMMRRWGPRQTTERNREGTSVIFADVNFGVPADSTDQDKGLIKRKVRRNEVVGTGGGLFWARLGKSEKEVTAFTECFANGQIRMLRGDDASRENFFRELENANVAHFVTHGYSFPANVKHFRPTTIQPVNIYRRNPWSLCGLVLAGANQTNELEYSQSIVSGEEIVARDYSHLQLVVLGACNTGRGEIYSGEGTRGMQQAFILSGAHTAIGTHWSVNNEKTEQIMEYFYEGIKAGSSVGDSIIQAQRKMRTNGEAMAHWGPWSVSGQWQTVLQTGE